MPRRRLLEIIDELHEEVRSRETITENDRAALRDLVADLQLTVDDDSDEDGASVLSSLRAAKKRFESDPRLTETLATISELLRSVGIS